ncbi:putative transposase, partial [Shigella sonnei 53G]
GRFTGTYTGADARSCKYGQLVKLPTRRERAFPRVVKERPWKYPTAPKKSQSVA